MKRENEPPTTFETRDLLEGADEAVQRLVVAYGKRFAALERRLDEVEGGLEGNRHDLVARVGELAGRVRRLEQSLALVGEGFMGIAAGLADLTGTAAGLPDRLETLEGRIIDVERHLLGLDR